MTIRIGDQQTISGADVLRYSEGPPNIADMRLTDDGDFVVVGLREGQTSLLLIHAGGREVNYRISVVDPTRSNVPADQIVVGDRENIRLDFYFVELSESYSHQIGIGFPGSIGGPGIGRANFVLDFVGPAAVGFSQASLQLVNQVLPRLDIAESSGWARVRRQAMIVTANGTQAFFANGGEVNFRIVGGLNNTIRTIEYGSNLRMTPRYDRRSGRIELQIQADVSELTDAASPEEPPGRRRTQLNSLVQLQPGQAIVMAGAVARSERESQGGLPGLSQIPFLGVLFGTNQRRGEANEALLFIVPTVVEPVRRADRDYIREALEIFGRFSGHIENVDLFGHEPPGYGRVGGTASGAIDRGGSQSSSD